MRPRGAPRSLSTRQNASAPLSSSVGPLQNATTSSSGPSAARSPVPTTTVPITIKTRVSVLKEINDKSFKGVSIDISWLGFLKNVLEDKGAGLINPAMYSVKTASGPRHNILENIRELMTEYKHVRKSFVVHFVENSKGTKRGAKATTNASAELGPSPASRTARTTAIPAWKIANAKRKKGESKRMKHEREASPTPSRASNQTAEMPGNRTRTPPVANTSTNRSSGTNRAGQQQEKNTAKGKKQTLGPYNSLPRDVLGDLLGATNGHRPFTYEEDDEEMEMDAASQMSQDSQGDLEEAGVAIEDIKPRVVKKMLKAVSNVQMLRIREEIRVASSKGQWLNMVRKIPQAGLFLQDIFLHN